MPHCSMFGLIKRVTSPQRTLSPQRTVLPQTVGLDQAGELTPFANIALGPWERETQLVLGLAFAQAHMSDDESAA